MEQNEGGKERMQDCREGGENNISFLFISYSVTTDFVYRHE
jgi:hypothetical protein